MNSPYRTPGKTQKTSTTKKSNIFWKMIWTVIKKITFIVILMGGLIGVVMFARNCSAEYEKNWEAARASEISQCQKAGYITPTWRKQQFYCADEQNVLHPVIEPACNTNKTVICGH